METASVLNPFKDASLNRYTLPSGIRYTSLSGLPSAMLAFEPMASTVRKIYLCGPIMDADPTAAKDWRTRAKERLAGRFILLDPLRRNFRDNEIDSANEIVEFDLQDVRDADLLLVNYCKPSLGTAMEVFYASHDLGKFVIAFSPFSYADCSPWMVRYCTKILPDLESSLAYIERHFT